MTSEITNLEHYELASDMFLCASVERVKSSSRDMSQELGESLSALTHRFASPVEFIGGDSVVFAEAEREPQRNTFRSDSEFFEATESYLFRPKPWLQHRADSDQESVEFLDARLSYDRLQEVTSLTEREHNEWKKSFVSFLVKRLAGVVDFYESNMNAAPDCLEANGYVCVFDELLAVVDAERVFLIWHGRNGYFG